MSTEPPISFPPEAELAARKFGEVFGASARPSYADWLHAGDGRNVGATLGYRRADGAPLFLEAYLDQPIERIVGKVFGRTVQRRAIVEIGNFAADNALAMIELWGLAANDLGGCNEIAVATLTAPLRHMFQRVGVPIVEIAPACAHRLGDAAADWGTYYAHDPVVCAGVIAQGQAAIGAFLSRRMRSAAA